MLICDMTVSMNGKITASNDDELCNIYNPTLKSMKSHATDINLFTGLHLAQN